MISISLFASGSGSNVEEIFNYFKDHPKIKVDLINQLESSLFHASILHLTEKFLYTSQLKIPFFKNMMKHLKKFLTKFMKKNIKKYSQKIIFLINTD